MSKLRKTKTINQIEISRLIAERTGLSLSDVESVLNLKHQYVISYLKREYKVILKNYLVLSAKRVKGKKFICPLNNKYYETNEHLKVCVSISDEFKKYINS